MEQRNDNAATSQIKRYNEIYKTLQAYQAAVNEVAIVSITDLSGKIIYVNKKFIEVSKYSEEELLGNTHRVVNSGFHHPSFFAEMWQTISKGQSWRSEIKNKAKDGTFYWVDTVITPVRDVKNDVFQYLSIRNIITAQKGTEEKLYNFQKALSRKEQQLKDAQEVAKTGSWHLDIPGNLLEWSEETYRIFEVPTDTPMTYETFLGYVHPDDKQRVDECWQVALKTGTYELEHRIKTSGGIKWIRERARLEFDPASKLAKAIGTAQDITEKKNTENELKASESLYKDLFNNSPFAIGIMDKETMQFLEVNETATKFYGYSREEFLHLTAYDIRIPEDHEKLKKLLQSDAYAVDNSTRTHRKKNGEFVVVEPTITAIDYKGRDAFLITINDVTEKNKIAEELFNTKINRQKEIARASLKAQEKSRTEIGRELHDNVNQLLVASTLYLKRAAPASENDKYLLVTGTDIIVKAIEEIRMLSAQLVPPSFNEQGLAKAIKLLAENLKLTNTAVEYDITIDETVLEEGLKVNLYRIVQEQFNNVIKYAAASKVFVKLKHEKKFLTLEISDNGKGFDQKQKAKGIGLANIYHRAEAYNGSVVIETNPGLGCKVKVVFAYPVLSAVN